MTSENARNQTKNLNARFNIVDCQYSDARKTTIDTPMESSFTSCGSRSFEKIMEKMKLKVREKMEVEQPIGSLSLAFFGSCRTLRISL